jgi:hypothetical protein
VDNLRAMNHPDLFWEEFEFERARNEHDQIMDIYEFHNDDVCVFVDDSNNDFGYKKWHTTVGNANYIDGNPIKVIADEVKWKQFPKIKEALCDQFGWTRNSFNNDYGMQNNHRLSISDTNVHKFVWEKYFLENSLHLKRSMLQWFELEGLDLMQFEVGMSSGKVDPFLCIIGFKFSYVSWGFTHFLEPFDKWTIDFVGPINPPSCRHPHILVCTYYVTQWMEEKTLSTTNKDAIVDFFHEEIFVRFRITREIVTERGTQFTSRLVKDPMENYKIKHRVTTPYHPHVNGQVEGTNKILEEIITKIVRLHLKD